MTQALPKSIVDNPALGRWLDFSAGRVGVRSGKVELGQGIAMALTQIVAEELDLSVGQVDIVPVNTTGPNEGLTAGSQSVEVSGASLRLAAAQARAALLEVAANRLVVDVESLSCRDGIILHNGLPTSIDFWALSAAVDWRQPITRAMPVKKVFDYRVVGQSHVRPDLVDKVTRGGFIHDIELPGMLHARVIRQPFRLAKLQAVDQDWLQRRYPDLMILRQHNFLALLGEDEYRVHQAHTQANSFTRWDEVPGLWQPAVAADAKRNAFGAAGVTTNINIAGRYTRANIAHASIGLSCGLAIYDAASLTVWSHSQGIFNLRDEIASCLGLDPGLVRVVHAPGAGCYGHNGADDAALDAAIVARARPGRPVRVQWSRQDELSRAPLGAAMSAEIQAALGTDGCVASWQISVTSAPHAQRPGFGSYINLTSAEALDDARLPATIADLPDITGGGASRNSVAVYDFVHQDVRVALDTRSPIRTSSLRSLGAHLNVFAIESAMDELANAGGVDPLAFRLRHLGDSRCRAVLEGVAQMSNWPGKRAPEEGRALGLAFSRYKNKGAWLAAVADVAVTEEVQVMKLWLCVDAGLIVNPAGARNQIEGGAIQAISWTLKEEVKIENGRVPTFDWESYPILKFTEIPEIETKFIIDANQPPLGTGEAAQGPVAGAIGNAVARALGKRIYDLPMTRVRIFDALMAD